MEKPGHTCPKILFIVYLKLKRNWVSRMQALSQFNSETSGLCPGVTPLKWPLLLLDEVQEPRARLPTSQPHPGSGGPYSSTANSPASRPLWSLAWSRVPVSPAPSSSPRLDSNSPSRSCFNPPSPILPQEIICSVTISHSP